MNGSGKKTIKPRFLRLVVIDGASYLLFVLAVAVMGIPVTDPMILAFLTISGVLLIPFFAAISLMACTCDISVEGGKGRKIYDVKLLKNDRCILKPYCKNNPLDCSFEFSTDANLEVEWSNTQESTLLLRVIAQDSFTSFSKVYEQEYLILHHQVHHHQ